MNKTLLIVSIVLLACLNSFSQAKTTQTLENVKQDTLVQSIMFSPTLNPNKTTKTPSVYSYKKLGVFCKLDVILQKKNKMNIFFRLGDGPKY